MIKKTKLNKKQIAGILENYSIGEVGDFYLIKKGMMHSNYFLQTNCGKFILRVFEGSRTIEQAQLEVKVLEKLRNTTFPAPGIILTTTKKYFSNYGNKSVAIFKFLEGEYIVEEFLTLQHIKSVGKNMGALHCLLKGFRPKEIFLKSDYSKDYAMEVLIKIKKEYPDFLIKKEKYIQEVLEKINLPKLPQGINHGDMFDDNVLFKGQKVSGVLDFDDCYYGNFLGDLGCGLAYWCINHEIDFKKCRKFVQAYESERKLNSQEKKYLYEQTLLSALIHVVHLFEDRKYWKKDIRPIRVINNLTSINKKDFNKNIF